MLTFAYLRYALLIHQSLSEREGKTMNKFNYMYVYAGIMSLFNVCSLCTYRFVNGETNVLISVRRFMIHRFIFIASKHANYLWKSIDDVQSICYSVHITRITINHGAYVITDNLTWNVHHGKEITTFKAILRRLGNSTQIPRYLGYEVIYYFLNEWKFIHIFT